MTTLSVEVSGRDVNLAIGPLFDDVTVNVIYNVVNTIVTQTITTLEQFIALEIEKGTFDQEKVEVAEDIFENNNNLHITDSAVDDILLKLGKHNELARLIKSALSEPPPLLVRDGGFIASGYSIELDELIARAPKPPREIVRVLALGGLVCDCATFARPSGDMLPTRPLCAV